MDAHQDAKNSHLLYLSELPLNMHVYCAGGAVNKKTAGFLGFYPISAAIRLAKCRAGLECAEEKPSSLLGFLGYCCRPPFKSKKRCISKFTFSTNVEIKLNYISFNII